MLNKIVRIDKKGALDSQSLRDSSSGGPRDISYHITINIVRILLTS